MNALQPPLLFALEGSRALGGRIAQELGIALADHEERDFEDGEHKARALENVRGRDVFVLHQLDGAPGASVNDKLCRLLFFLGALRDASAASVAAVIPYMVYARKDRKTKTRDPLTSRYMAQILEAVGTDRVVTMDVHNLAAFQNAFRCRTDHLVARPVFVRHFAPLLAAGPVSVVSPDVGGAKRAEAFRTALGAATGAEIAGGFMDKKRSGGVVSGDMLVGAVDGRAVIILDDMISTGTTMLRAAKACRSHGATRAVAAATHAVFQEGTRTLLSDPAIDQVVVTDTVTPGRLALPGSAENLVVLETAPLFAEAIRRIHEGGSVTALDDALPA